MKLLIKSGTLVTARRERRGDLLVEDGRIAAVDDCLEVPGAEVIDAAGCMVFPGFIDAHTHLDMECAAGVTADDFATGTRAALAGGTTTILDFATQGKGQTLAQGLAAWESKAAGKALCDYGFHMAITHWTDDIPAQMEEMCRRGVTSFKVYLAYDDLRLTPEQIGKVLEAAARLGAVVGAHCEDGDAVNAGIAGQKALGNLAPAAHPASRPNWVEADAVRQFLDLAKRAGAEAYVVHLSTREGLEAVREARGAGQTVWAETCPHYLALEESLYRLPGFQGAKLVCSPPLRSREDRSALWQAVRAGEIQVVATDHCSFRFDSQKTLGRGTCTTSQIFYTSPSRCAVADSCSISIDRRMTAGETWDSCLQEIRDLPAVKKYGEDVKVSMYMYDRPSWTGEVYETESYFPTWINKETAAHVQALVDAHRALFGDKRVGPDGAMALRDRPLTDKWTFSTNGVAIQGRYGIPCVGFGPGAESQAHAPNEITWKDDLVRCAALYAAVPGLYREDKKTADVTQFRAGKTGNDIQ